MSREHLPPDMLSRLDPVEVKDYARATGWVREQRLGGGRVAVFSHPASDLDQVLVPLNKGGRDFGLAMSDVINILAEKEQRPAPQILSDLLAPPADRFRFHEEGADAAGNVPLDHGIDMLEGARKQLRAAACSEIRPQRYFPRMRLADADDFVAACRYFPPEAGSFIVSVSCPLRAVPGPPLFQDSETPFTRRVAILLMRSLHKLAAALQADELGPLVDAPAEGGPLISSNLCEALAQMGPLGDGSTLTVSASWARTLPVPGVLDIPRSVRFPREWFPAIEGLAVRLRPAPESRRRVFVGLVDILDGRPNDEGRREGWVTLQILHGGSETRKARVDLDADSHAVAYQAYEKDDPVRLEGVLRQHGRVYHIEDVNNFARVAQDVTQPAREAVLEQT